VDARNVALRLVAFVAGGAQASGGDLQFTDVGRNLWGWPTVRQFIDGQLLVEKAVIRMILVERGDDVSAVPSLALSVDLERSGDGRARPVGVLNAGRRRSG